MNRPDDQLAVLLGEDIDNARLIGAQRKNGRGLVARLHIHIAESIAHHERHGGLTDCASGVHEVARGSEDRVGIDVLVADQPLDAAGDPIDQPDPPRAVGPGRLDKEPVLVGRSSEHQPGRKLQRELDAPQPAIGDLVHRDPSAKWRDGAIGGKKRRPGRRGALLHRQESTVRREHRQHLPVVANHPDGRDLQPNPSARRDVRTQGCDGSGRHLDARLGRSSPSPDRPTRHLDLAPGHHRDRCENKAQTHHHAGSPHRPSFSFSARCRSSVSM